MSTTADNTVHVGIDVSKHRLDVCILPSRQIFSYDNTTQGRDQLVRKLKPHKPTRVVLESTGGYEDDIATAFIECRHPDGTSPPQTRSTPWSKPTPPGKIANSVLRKNHSTKNTAALR